MTGVAAAVFVRGLHWAEDLLRQDPGRYLRHVLGMLLVGVLIYALMRWGGHYYVEGVGYATIQATLTRPARRRAGSCCCSCVQAVSPRR